MARYSSRYLAIRLLGNDKNIREIVASRAANSDEIDATAARLREKLEHRYGESAETIITDAKYGFIAGALEETYRSRNAEKKHVPAERIDRVMTHRIWGLPIFLLLMWITFQTTFSLGGIPAEWMEAGVQWLGDWVTGLMPEGSLRELLVGGIISGVGGVIVFLPNILILFFFISLMEDTGYMARAAFIMDKLMHKIGLHGKSFIPLLMGFGCNVPAIMATRTLESRKDRVLTMLIIPFMSCSARLPVYVLLISTFFPHNQGLVLFSIYLIGILIAVLSSVLFKKLLFAKQEAPFVMELPPYRIPTARNVVRHMWDKGAQYLKKMGTVILLASIIIWALGHYPRNVEYSTDYAAEKALVAASERSAEEKQAQIQHLDNLQYAEHQEKSYIGRIGHFIEPAIRPLGFDWRIGVSLASGLAAKEVVVSTMAVLNNSGDDETMLARNLQKQTYSSGPKAGEHVYTPLVAYTLMIFILLYFPCIAAMAAIRREAGGRWALFTLFYTTALAWLLSLLVYQIGSLF